MNRPDAGFFVGLIAPDGTVFDVNRSALEASGLTRQDVVGRSFWETGWWNRSAHVEAWLRAGFDQALRGEPFRGESTYVLPDGTPRIVECASTPMKDERDEVRFVVQTAIDVTDRRRAAQEWLIDSQVRREFMAALAHELRNPLAPIRNAVSILREKGSRDPEVQWCRDVIGRQVEELARLLSDWLEPAADGGEVIRDAGPGRRSRCRVLVVDDNHDGADSLAMLLGFLGHDVRTAYDGEAAVALAEEYRPQVVLLDVEMPKMNGYDACRRIRQQPWSQGVTLVACTGWGQDEDRQRTKEAGFNYHIVKPIDPAVLQDVIDTGANPSTEEKRNG